MRFRSDRLYATEQAEAGADHFGQAREDLGEVTTRLLLDRHGDSQKAHVLHVQTFRHFLEGFGHIATIGTLIRDHAKFGGQRIRQLFGDDLHGRGKRVADFKAAHHELDGIGQLLFDQGHTFVGFHRDPNIDAADADSEGNDRVDHRTSVGGNRHDHEGQARQRRHDQDQLLRGKCDGGLLRL